jgi:hypothetical protein
MSFGDGFFHRLFLNSHHFNSHCEVLCSVLHLQVIIPLSLSSMSEDRAMDTLE